MSEGGLCVQENSRQRPLPWCKVQGLKLGWKVSKSGAPGVSSPAPYLEAVGVQMVLTRGLGHRLME